MKKTSSYRSTQTVHPWLISRDTGISGTASLLLFLLLVVLFSATGCGTTSSGLRFVSIDRRGKGTLEDEKLAETLDAYDDAVEAENMAKWSEADSLFRNLEAELEKIPESHPDSVRAASYMMILAEVRNHRENIEKHLDSSALFNEGADMELMLGGEDTFQGSGRTKDVINKGKGYVSHSKTQERIFIEDTAPVIHSSSRYRTAMVSFTGRERKNLDKWFKRADEYLPMVRRKLAEHGLPMQLAYLPVIESGYNPRAYSRARAAGMWQFISSTARRYGLRVDYWVDERLDPEASTDAALSHLENLYKMFGNWSLALAAYNSGEGRVLRAVKRQGVRNYLDLRLPRETKDYVPRLLAVLTIASNPGKYGFHTGERENHHEEPDIVTVNQCVGIDVVAECAGVDRKIVAEMNPALRRWCTHPDGGTRLRLPHGTGEKFKSNLAVYPKEKLVSWTRHRVRRGETVSGIARKYGTTVSAIVKVNRLHSAHSIIAGNTLVIPIPAIRGSDIHIPSIVSERSVRRNKGFRGYVPSYHKVRRGDTPCKIAKKYGIALDDLLKWNGLSKKSTIYPGQKLALHGRNSSPDSGNLHLDGKYRVKKGDTLAKIALKLGVSARDLASWNSLGDPNRLIIGQELLYARAGTGKKRSNVSHSSPRKYRVRKGDTVSGIASGFGVSADEIISMNRLKDRSKIYAGQILLIPDNNRNREIHVVKKGESLYTIGRRYGISVSEIKRRNGLGNSNNIQPGQKLVIH